MVAISVRGACCWAAAHAHHAPGAWRNPRATVAHIAQYCTSMPEAQATRWHPLWPILRSSHFHNDARSGSTYRPSCRLYLCEGHLGILPARSRASQKGQESAVSVLRSRSGRNQACTPLKYKGLIQSMHSMTPHEGGRMLYAVQQACGAFAWRSAFYTPMRQFHSAPRTLVAIVWATPRWSACDRLT